MRLTLRNVRLAFPNLFVATRVNGEGEPAFSGSFILPTNHAQVAEIKAAMRQVAKDKWGAKADAIYKTMEATDKLALHNGDTKSQYEGFEGNLFISSRSKTRPSVRNVDASTVSQEDGIIYSGCYVYGFIEFWAQDNKFGKRINAQLRGVQFFRDGDAFAGGGTPASDEEFESLSTADSEIDPTA